MKFMPNWKNHTLDLTCPHCKKTSPYTLGETGPGCADYVDYDGSGLNDIREEYYAICPDCEKEFEAIMQYRVTSVKCKKI